METFRIKAVPRDGVCTLLLTGEADLAVAPDLIELGSASLEDPGIHTLVVDLGQVSFVDSTAIGALIRLHNVAEEAGKTFRLDNLPRRVRQVLGIAGLQDFFSIAPEVTAPDGTAPDGTAD
jgi:anti-anti-sigma factor